MSLEVLQLSSSNTAQYQAGYWQRLEDDRYVNENFTKVDTWAGAVTGSFHTEMIITGSIANMIGQIQIIGYARTARIIKEVFATAVNSGSDGVTSIDIMHTADNGAIPSIFEGNAAARLNLSASKIGISPAVIQTFASGSTYVWPAYSALMMKVNDAAIGAGPNAQSGIIISVAWAPSGSYGA